MTQGYKTTEFWITTIASILGIAATIGVISPDQADVVKTSVSQIIGGVIAIISVVQYVRSRTQLKAAAIAASVK